MWWKLFGQGRFNGKIKKVDVLKTHPPFLFSWTTSLRTTGHILPKNEALTISLNQSCHRISHRLRRYPLKCCSKNSVFICHKGRDSFEKNKLNTDKICSMGVHFVGSTPKGGKIFIKDWPRFVFGLVGKSWRIGGKTGKAPVSANADQGLFSGWDCD